MLDADAGAAVCDSDVTDLPVAVVPTAALVAADSPRRAGENVQHVRLLAGSADRLPPIVVHRPTMQVIDGMHRLKAAELRGEQQVEVRYFDGSEAAAFVLAVRLNVQHGLPLALTDRRQAADRILGLFPQWSDRRIASVTGLSPPTVAARRRCLTDKNLQSDSRVGKDGRVRPADAAQRRQLAAQVLTRNPAASLRQVATQAGLSRETVRKVRNELAGPRLIAPSRPGDQLAEEQLARALRQPAGDPVRAGQPRGWQALRADPAFRSADTGRVLLQVLAASQALLGRVDQIIGATPSHCLGALRESARHCAGGWLEFAAQAEQRRQVVESGWTTGK